MSNPHVFLEYPSGDQRHLPINDWIYLKNLQSMTGEYPCAFWFSSDFTPDVGLVTHFQQQTNQGVYRHARH